ncbi:MAG: hypothetical protein IPN14_08310 [Bacteroidetes bacterium]|nr:hypothetical protein [Bacteroidota bacterium]
MKLYVIPIDKSVWDSQEFQILSEQFFSSLRRISKGNDLQLERNRYFNSTYSLIDVCLKNAINRIIPFPEKFNSVLINNMPEYFGKKIPIVEPKYQPKFIKLFQSFDFVEKLKNEYGFFILQDSFGKSKDDFSTKAANALLKSKPVAEQFQFSINYNSLVDFNKVEIDYLNYVLDCVRQQIPIGWLKFESDNSNQHSLARHETLTKILRELTSKDFLGRIENPNEAFQIALQNESIKIQFAYEDGSIGNEIPLFSLEELNISQNFELFKASLISSRHYELDNLVDCSLIRNSELSIRDGFSFSDQERYCYERTVTFITEFLSDKRQIELQLFHTGLETGIIGVYSAIVELLRKPTIRKD